MKRDINEAIGTNNVTFYRYQRQSRTCWNEQTKSEKHCDVTNTLDWRWGCGWWGLHRILLYYHMHTKCLLQGTLHWKVSPHDNLIRQSKKFLIPKMKLRPGVDRAEYCSAGHMHTTPFIARCFHWTASPQDEFCTFPIRSKWMNNLTTCPDQVYCDTKQ